MNLILAGINHRTAPVEIRERMNIAESRLPAVLSDLVGRDGIVEGLILSTCNRVEVVANAAPGIDPEPLIRSFLADTHHCNLAPYERHLYWRRQEEAVEHLFRVAASLDSMVLGEPQILGQVKQAFAIAQKSGAIKSELHDVMNHALAAAKRVRRETAVGNAAISVSYAAVELAKKIFGTLDGKTVFILGAGKMSELAARHLAASGAESIFVSNRTYSRAAELAIAFGGKAVHFEEIFDHLHLADIVISSTGAPHFVIGREQAEQILAVRKNRPIFFVDIAVPRDIDPEVNHLDNAFVYDIDDLEQVVAANKEQRRNEAARAEEILRQESAKTMRHLASREVTPAIVAVEQRLRLIRDQETERFHNRLSTLSPEQRDAVDALTQAILNKVLHGPVSELKNAASHPERGAVVQMVRKIFGVSE
ncbi:MAG: glutamyl-tRNA reductase [Acidobacteriota bacterium]|nr:glutamyl-tRNA reductase [Acidobacteriota bacterium]